MPVSLLHKFSDWEPCQPPQTNARIKPHPLSNMNPGTLTDRQHQDMSSSNNHDKPVSQLKPDTSAKLYATLPSLDDPETNEPILTWDEIKEIARTAVNESMKDDGILYKFQDTPEDSAKLAMHIHHGAVTVEGRNLDEMIKKLSDVPYNLLGFIKAIYEKVAKREKTLRQWQTQLMAFMQKNGSQRK
jgi:hypothetical protein